MRPEHLRHAAGTSMHPEVPAIPETLKTPDPDDDDLQ